jgi:hypothetical protein
MNLLLRGSVAALLCAGLAFGQWSGISTVGEGHKIRVETAQKKYKGTFSGLTDTAVKLTSGDGEVSVPRSEVLRVYSQSQSHRVRNTIIGTAIGVAVGVTLYGTLGALFRNESSDDTTPMLVAPMAVGAALGAVLPTGRMMKIYDAKDESGSSRRPGD